MAGWGRPNQAGQASVVVDDAGALLAGAPMTGGDGCPAICRLPAFSTSSQQPISSRPFGQRAVDRSCSFVPVLVLTGGPSRTTVLRIETWSGSQRSVGRGRTARTTHA